MSGFFDTLIAGSIRHRAFVLLAAAAGVVLVASQITHAHLDALPSFTPPQVTVQAEAPGYGSVEVEQQITTPLEQRLLGIPGVASLRSTASAGLSVTRLTFEDDADIFRARQLVQERVTQAAGALPRDVPAPQLGPISSPVGALLKFTYTAGADASFAALGRFAQWELQPRLEAIPGVARVTVHGAPAVRVELRVDPLALLSTGIGLGGLRDAVQAARSTAALGFVTSPSQRLPLRADTRWTLERARALAELPLPGGDLPRRVGDVADVVVGEAPPVGAAMQDGRRAIYVQIDKLPWSDTLRLTHRVEGVLDELDRDLPLGGHRLPPVFRQADFIHTSLRSVARAMFLGAIIVVLVLSTSLRSRRAAVISLSALPLSLLAAVGVLLLRGVSIDGMVLGGLAIAVGEVVDDAIVDVENIWRRLGENAAAASPRPVLTVIHDGSVEVRGAVVYASMIVVVVLLPVLEVGGLAGRIFSPLAEAYALAVTASLVVALTVTPALAALLWRHGAEAERPESPVMGWARLRYERVLTQARARPGPRAAVAVGVGVLALLALALVRGGFLPEFREGVLIGEVTAWPGTSLEEAERLTQRITARFKPGGPATHVAARVGRASMDEDAAPVHRVEMDLVLPPDAGDPEEAAATILHKLGTVPGERAGVDGFLGERINELLSGERAPIALELHGDDLLPLRAAAARLAEHIGTLPGVTSSRSPDAVDGPTTDIEPDTDALALAGASPRDLRLALATHGQGTLLTTVAGPRGVPVPVVLAEAEALRSDTLADVPVWGASPVPLSQVATLRDGSEPAAVRHEGGQPLATVAVQVAPGALSSVSAAIQREMRTWALPAGVRWNLAGQGAERDRARGRLLQIAAGVLAVIFAFLWLAFGSWIDALVVVGGIPMGLAGGVVAALALPDGISLAGLIGFVTLAGIISRNGIMLVAHKNHLLAAHPQQDREDLIVQAARERLRPILMTAATAFGGLLPLALSMEAAGSELESPMALVVCGGLLTSTVLNLVAVPSFYLWLEHRRTGGETT